MKGFDIDKMTEKDLKLTKKEKKILDSFVRGQTKSVKNISDKMKRLRDVSVNWRLKHEDKEK